MLISSLNLALYSGSLIRLFFVKEFVFVKEYDEMVVYKSIICNSVLYYSAFADKNRTSSILLE